MKQAIASMQEQYKKCDSPQKDRTITALLSILRSKHNIPKQGVLTAVEVKTLTHSEEGGELYPLYLFDGIIKGTVECKYDVPIMKKLIKAYFNSSSIRFIEEMERDYRDIVSTIERRGYILDSEIKKLKKARFKVITEDIPAIFVIAPKGKKPEEGNHDPIILIKYGEDTYYRVHIWKGDNNQ